MQAGVIGGICLLAFLSSKGRAEETNGLNEYKLEAPSDLKNEIGLAITESNLQENDGRSGAISQSAPRTFGGSSLSQPEGRVNSDSGLLYNSYPFSPSYPYSSGANLPRPQAEAGNGLYQAAFKSSPNLNYNQGKSSVSAQTHNVLYQPLYESNPMSNYRNDPSFNLLSDLSSNYQDNPETKSVGSITQLQSDIEPYQPLPIPNAPYHSLVPYTDLSSPQTKNDNEDYQPVPLLKQKENYYTVPYHENSGLNIISHRSHVYDSETDQAESKNNPYQAIPILDLNSASINSKLVPYKEPTRSEANSINVAYQFLTIPTSSRQREVSISKVYSEDLSRPYSADILTSKYSEGFNRNTLISKSSGESELHQTVVVPDSEHITYNDGSSFAQRPTTNEVHRPILRMDPSEDTTEPSESISRFDPDPSSNEHSSNANTKTHVSNDVSDFSSASRSSDSYDTPKQNGHDPGTNYDLTVDLKSKSDWTPHKYDPPSMPTAQLYPLGADKQGHADFRPAAGGAINQYSLGPYDYPSESPFQPGYNKATYEGHPNMIATHQNSPIAFEDAKSRMVPPHEYIFPNKMPGGENVIQCGKENEFHHFWSDRVDCMTCICLNEYGVLTPVCASCGGCRKSSPQYPEPIPELPVPISVQPATPKPSPIIPESHPPPAQPEPSPEMPIPVPNLEIPTPKYPPPIPGPSPIPEGFPEPIPTLPPQPAQATCSPLPSGQPFTNPLHPCQICICKESNLSGKPDVQIECKENPQCISPVDVTTLPPLPDVPMPVPLPICEKFPEHVLFPHPTDTCKLCKCSKRDTERGIPEQLITCYPHPDCIPKAEPTTEPVPSLPIPLDPYRVKLTPQPEPIPAEPMIGQHEPIEPVPLPEIVTVEPLPWPPITTVSPGPPLPVLTPKPGPLPGPSPHESCRPYPPNQTFQHPWDECQICLCTEATAVGMITVEVNCYTKPSCCIEPPESLKAAISGKLTLLSGYGKQYPVISNPVIASDVSLSTGVQPAVITSTFRPPSIYPSYTPRSEPLKQGYTSQMYLKLQTEPGYVDPSPNYQYPRNYQPSYVNQQYPEYPPRLPPVPPGPYKTNNFEYQPNYEYAPGDAMENNYPPPQARFQTYDPRFQTAPSAYPAVYQRYDRPPVYPPAPPNRDVYGKPAQKPIGANVQNVQSNYLGNTAKSKSGKDDDELDDT